MGNIDTYTLRARLLPAFIVVFPLALIPIVIYPDSLSIWKFVAGLCVSLGLTALLAQLGRDQGKMKEPDLLVSWGGKPSTLILSHVHTTLSQTTLRRYHEKLALCVSGIILPTIHEENLNPDSAFEIYDSCVQYLREKTRDRSEFAVIFAENVNYGFRRNLWAMKQAGIFTTCIGLLICASVFAHSYTMTATISGLPLIGGLICSLLLSIWALRINAEWVKIPAHSYAERLLASLDIININ